MGENERLVEIVHMMQHLIGDLQEQILRHDQEIGQMKEKAYCRTCGMMRRWKNYSLCKACYERQYITPLWEA